MRLLLDEHFTPVIAERLRARGHDVIAVAAELQLRQLPDETLLDRANAAGRALVTQDVADFPTVHQELLGRGGSHAGLVLVSRRFTRRPEAIGGLVRALEALLEANRSERAPSCQLRWL